jgi:hypothetical protein
MEDDEEAKFFLRDVNTAIDETTYPVVYITHIGGFPIRKAGANKFTLLGQPLNPKALQEHMTDATQSPAVPVKTWGHGGVHITMMYVNYPSEAKREVMRSHPFERGRPGPEASPTNTNPARCFAVMGSVGNWSHYVRLRYQDTTSRPLKDALSATWEALNWLLGDELFPSVSQIHQRELDFGRTV